MRGNVMRILPAAAVILAGMTGIASSQSVPPTRQEIADAWNTCEHLPPVMVDPNTGRLDVPTRLRTKKTWPGNDQCQVIENEFKKLQDADAKAAALAKAKSIAERLGK